MVGDLKSPIVLVVARSTTTIESRRIRLLLGGAVLTLASCGGPSEAEQIAALAGAVDTDVEYLDQDEASCVATNLLAAGTGDKPPAGLALVAEIEDGSADLLAFMDSDQGGAAIDECVDIGARFDTYLSDTFDEQSNPDCADTTSFQTDPLRSALVEDLANSESWVDDENLQTQLVDAARGCVSKTTFAVMAGLDDPEELASALIADPFAKYDDIEYQDECVVEAIVSGIGIERLSEMEVTIDDPRLSVTRANLEDPEHDAIMAGIETCQPQRLVERLISNTAPQLTDCISSELDDEEIDQVIERAVSGQNAVRRDPLRTLFQTCTDEVLEELFGPTPEHSDDVRYWVNEFAYAAGEYTDMSQFESECLVAGYLSVTDDDDLAAVEPYVTAVFQEQIPSQSSAQAFTDMMRDYGEFTRQCLEPWTRIQTELTIAEISEESFACLERSMDIDSILYGYELEFEAFWEGSPAGLNRIEDMLTELGEHIETCGTSTDQAKWADFMDLIFGPLYEEVEGFEALETT